MTDAIGVFFQVILEFVWALNNGIKSSEFTSGTYIDGNGFALGYSVRLSTWVKVGNANGGYNFDISVDGTQGALKLFTVL